MMKIDIGQFSVLLSNVLCSVYYYVMYLLEQKGWKSLLCLMYYFDIRAHCNLSETGKVHYVQFTVMLFFLLELKLLIGVLVDINVTKHFCLGGRCWYWILATVAVELLYQAMLQLLLLKLQHMSNRCFIIPCINCVVVYKLLNTFFMLNTFISLCRCFMSCSHCYWTINHIILWC